MFCPHCHNKIPDGSNICPLCYANLAGVKPQISREEEPFTQEQPMQRAQPKKAAPRKSAYSKGSRGSRKPVDRTPQIVAVGLILILLVIVVMIVRSMFSASSPVTPAPSTPQPQTTGSNFVVFGATATPNAQLTPTPPIEVTPTPTPVQQTVIYTTLRRGDNGPDVVTLQQALNELGYLSGAVDGNFGTNTMTAVRKFQEDNGLDADGIAGRLTLEALYARSSVTPIPDVTAAPGDIMDLPG